MLKTDVLITGSEGAGARAAIAASEHGADVIVATKGRIGKSGATITAIAALAVGGQGIREVLNLPGHPEDTPEVFFEDIITEGKYINNQKLVGQVVDEGPFRMKELMDWGMQSTASDLPIPGHRFPRDIDTTGRQMVKALKKKIQQCRNIRIIEDLMITDLLKADRRVIGAVGIDLCKGDFVVISAKAVILSTGGAQTVYPVTTAPEELTGDGQAMAYRAGADLIDMEMVQFRPCNFIWPPIWKGIGFPFTIGPGGGIQATWLLNKWGERFMSKWDPERMENTTRDISSIAIMTEVIEGRGSPHGGAFLSLAHLPYNLIDNFGKWFLPGIVSPNWHFVGFNFAGLVEDIKKGYAMEVGPACHFFMGGIRIDEHCRTTVEGLYAIGEVAGGTNGANRLSGVALTQIFVQGANGGEAAAFYAKKQKDITVDAQQIKKLEEKITQPLLRDKGANPFEVRKSIQDLAWQKVGVVRTGASLLEAQDEIRRMKGEDLPNLSCRAKEREYNREWVEAIQIENLLTTLECIARSALERKESRGAHFRKDYPEMDNNNWLINTVLHNRQGEMALSRVPVVVTRFTPPGKGEN